MKKTLAFVLALSVLLACFPFVASAGEDLPVISWFTVGMTVKDAKSISPALKGFTHNGKTLSNDDLLSTGDVATTDNGDYQIIVCGDVCGEGKVSARGYINIKRSVLGTRELSEVEFLAADLNKDGKISSLDYIRAKRLVLGTYKMEKPENAENVPVLLYHHILPDADRNTSQWRGNEITIATSEFTRHMQMLTDGEHYVATVEEVVQYVRGEILLPKGSICLTFDDGYKSNTYYAAPILRDFGFKATVFAITSFYDDEYQADYDATSLQHMTERDLESAADVIDQQSHTWYNHNQLSSQSYNEIYNDLMLSQSVDENRFFAYPYGMYNSTVINAVRDAGFEAAFTTERDGARPGDAIYEIPRYTITSPLSDSEYLAYLAKAK